MSFFLSLNTPKSLSKRLLVTLPRKSTAKYIPFASLPGAFISLGFEAPQAKITASYSSFSFSADTYFTLSEKLVLAFSSSIFLLPQTFTLVSNLIPASSISLTRLSITDFSSFMFGIPYRRSPPTRSLLSKTVTSCPRLFRSWAAASPEGPLPTTATFFPVLTFGTTSFTRSLSNANSIIAFSFSLVETGS